MSASHPKATDTSLMIPCRDGPIGDVASPYAAAKKHLQSLCMGQPITSFSGTHSIVSINIASEIICGVFIHVTHCPDCLNRSLFT
jgi:hypothetical protein